MSIADLPVMALHWVGAMAPILMAACSVCRAARYSCILPEIESSDIGRQDWGIVRSRFGLGITIQVAYFQFFGK